MAYQCPLSLMRHGDWPSPPEVPIYQIVHLAIEGAGEGGCFFMNILQSLLWKRVLDSQ